MSLKLHNDTPFAAEIFEQLNHIGKLVQCVAVRGTFRIFDDAFLELSDEQTPFLWADEYQGDLQDAVLLKQADFIPYKPATDVTVRGFTYAPQRHAKPSWLTGIRVSAKDGRVVLEKVLRAYGPRSWMRVNSDRVRSDRNVKAGAPTDFVLTSAEPVKRVPLQWQYSSGGQYRDGAEIAFDLRNPVGTSLPGLDGDSARDCYPAPLFEAADCPISDPALLYEPQNLAPVPPAWSGRLRHAGTYDQTWKDKRWPLLPQDFDHRFYNCAAVGMVAEPWLAGGEQIELLNLSSQHEKLKFGVPAVHLGVQHDGGLNQLLRLDGVHIDTDHETVALTWRTGFMAISDVSDVFLQIFHDETVNRRDHQVSAVGS